MGWIKISDEKCKICGSKFELRNWKKQGYLCNKHRLQMQRHGKILDRTVFDKNDFIEKGDDIIVLIRNKRGKIVGETIIDKEQKYLLSTFKFGLCQKYVKISKGRSIRYYLHKYILGNPNSEVDHIDGNRMNNKKSNLRTVTHAQNNWNKKVKGYYWNKIIKKYHVCLVKLGKKYNIGYFDSEAEATNARRIAELKHFGKYAYKYDLTGEKI